MKRKIRMAKYSDGRVLRDIARNAYTPYIAEMGQPPAPMLSDFDSHIANDTVFVCEESGNVCGYAVVLKSEGGYWLDNIAIQPAMQSCGIGRELIAVVENWLAERTDHYQLYTNIKMTRNIDLYRRMGFAETDRRTVSGYDRVYFRRRL